MNKNRIPLTELITLQRGFDLPSRSRKSGTVPIIASTGINGYHSEAKVSSPGVVIGRSGSIGGGQYINEPFWPLNTTLWVKDFKGHHPKFIYYFLKSVDFTRFNAGSGVPTLNRNHLGSVMAPKLSFEEERHIAELLSPYDDLIENNRRRIQLLEESARLLYQEWFVHLRFPGHEHVKVVDGVPEGWKATVIKSFGQVITGKTPSKKETDNYGSFMPFVKTPDMSSGAITLHANEYLSEKGASSQKNKTLPLGTVLISCIGTVGVVSITGCTCQTNQQINAVIPKEDTLRYYVYFTLKGLKAAMLAIGAGATMSNINKHKFENMAAVLPSLKLLENFHETVEPTFEQIKVLLTTNSKLEKARDLLLPRLMNGELL